MLTVFKSHRFPGKMKDHVYLNEDLNEEMIVHNNFK